MKHTLVFGCGLLLLRVSSAIGQLPSCTPPVSSTIAIAYHGSSSGCSQAAGSPPCVVGENVQFSLASGADVGNCFIVYTWNFPEGSVTGQPPQNHQFQNPGTFTVTLMMTNDSPPFTLSVTQPVHVAAATSIPIFEPRLLILLTVVLGVVAISRLK